MSSPHPLPRAARTAGRVTAWTLGAVLVIAVIALAWIGVRGGLAYGHLRSAQQTAERAAHGAADTLRDPAQAAALVADLSSDTAAARALTSDPVWRAGEALPWLGPQLHAVSTVAAALDDVASDALAPLATTLSTFSLDSLRPSGGRIDLASITAVQQPAATAAAGLTAAAESVAGLDQSPLAGPVRRAVGEVSGLLQQTAQATDAVSRAVTLLPPMLGQDGPRNYLVVFQNNAEWRSLGGIVGAMAMIHTEGGGLSLAAQGSSSDFARYDEPVIDLGSDLFGIYGTQPARWIQNVTQIPDFSLTGTLAREMWQRETGVAVDGVISLDPVALSYLLQATGPVDLPTGEQLTAENAVDLLLNGVYLRYQNPADQDAFFAAAAAAVFGRLADGAADPTALVTALSRAGDERRLSLWSARPEDQAVLEGTTLVGPLPPDDADQRGFGVYLNDGTGSKMDFYADAQVGLSWGSCTAATGDEVTGEVTLTVTVANNAPEGAATVLPEYITGGGGFGVAAGLAKTVGYLYLPVGAELIAATVSDGSGFGGGFHDGRQVMSFSTTLASGQATTASLTVRLKTPGPGTAVAWITPTVHADAPTAARATCAAP